MSELAGWLSERRAEVEALLQERVPQPADDPGRLVEAVRYSLLSAGKRLRPLLGLAAAEAVGAPLTPAVRIATAAIELVHCYSLVHDDLPAMDDDDLRRGRPTNHKVFGDAIAILAGDALLTLAFTWLADAGALAEAERPGQAAAYLQACGVLAHASGLSGMVRGQARDLGEPAPSTLTEADQLHAEKTGALFRAAVEIGAIVGHATPVQRNHLRRYGEAYGVAFQHADDLADQEHASLATLARQRLTDLTSQAVQELASFGPQAEPLRELARALAASA
ncbi:MAG: polyprenyl synthetase family protein [Deltaproteobacteria bacterium]|nr:polyprenyl synthetase family protein [Deltaproteobacteria bacterium]